VESVCTPWHNIAPFWHPSRCQIAQERLRLAEFGVDNALEAPLIHVKEHGTRVFEVALDASRDDGTPGTPGTPGRDGGSKHDMAVATGTRGDKLFTVYRQDLERLIHAKLRAMKVARAAHPHSTTERARAMTTKEARRERKQAKDKHPTRSPLASWRPQGTLVGHLHEHKVSAVWTWRAYTDVGIPLAAHMPPALINAQFACMWR